MEISLIRTKPEYDAAMRRIHQLLDLDPAEDTPESDELELLTLVVAHYEKQHAAPPEPLDPVDYLEFLLDQETITRKDLVPLLGSVPRVSEVLARRRQLSLAMIRRLREALNIPADILLRPIAVVQESPRKGVRGRPRKQAGQVSHAFA